ncbi:DUF2225 domain-containing protein [Halalkalibacter akibai]|uniref:DUF2225 domain-containing protein n=1 Tax=Halalkalibacter akibai (strain ATCC 43226 / DSM 21942 / CIP 109018 / JCM 9157 / 1139) TaxID=1236973 RepID=W4QUQ3_HALA3|nr:DUF2225 domain-containing protein [Halalkalibacter akibai]GAE35627.1 hypothetical protein JCM9157_2744 [Halalkalibacter akibai JCM 9157]
MENNIAPLYDKKVLCFYCGHSFQSKRVRSRFIRVQKVESDFCKIYKDGSFNPTLYEADVCPSCGFTSTEAFSSTFPIGTKEEIAKHFSSWQTQEFGKERTVAEAIKAMKLAFLSATLKKENPVVIGGICLRLAWIYRSIHKQDDEKRFLKAALTHYKVSYEQGDYQDTQMSELHLLYLLGELARRIERTDEASKYFTKIIQHKERSTNEKIVEMAREQWYEIRNNSEKGIPAK